MAYGLNPMRNLGMVEVRYQDAVGIAITEKKELTL
jgi:hypothetical protein